MKGKSRRSAKGNFGAIIVEGEPNFIPPLAGEVTFQHYSEPIPVIEGVSFNTLAQEDSG